MNDALLNFELTGDKTQARVKPAIEKDLITALEIEQIMFELAELRAAMAPQVPDEIPVPARQRIVPNAQMSLMPETTDAGILRVRDIGRGWLSYRLERSELERLYSSISALLQRPQMTKQ